MKLFLDKIEAVLEKFYISEKNYQVLESKIKIIEEKLKEIRQENNLTKKELYEVSSIFESIKVKNSHSESFWSGTIDFIIKIIWIIVVSFILYKLGINPPPV